MTSPGRNAKTHRARAFTLVEVMISITIALILLLGVNQVFDSAGRTIGAGNAVNEATRAGRAMQSLIAEDIRNMTTDGPLLVLRNRAQWAHRNEADERLPGTVSQLDEDNDGVITPSSETLKFTDYNFRRHRLDLMSFFVRNLVRRQTGNDGTWQAATAGTEGWVWYGHMKLPNNSYDPSQSDATAANRSAYRLPWDAAPNENNQYASQWVLGRVRMLLMDPSEIKDRNNPLVQQVYIRAGMSSAGTLGPLAINTEAYPAQSPTVYVQDSRYDVGGASIDSFRQLLEQTKWQPWDKDATYYTQDTSGGRRSCCMHNGVVWRSRIDNNQNNTPAPGSSSWELFDYNEFMNGERFQCNPFIVKPVDSAGAAKYVPFLAAACTQFMVEYAGDFLTQDANGDVTGVCWDYAAGTERATDGQVDYVVDKSADGTPTKIDSAKWVRRVRWYGLPREVKVRPDGAVAGNQATASAMPDVVPLRDIWQTAVSGSRAPFEKVVPTAAADYSATEAREYVCVWGPNDRRPKMIRILMAFDDPAGNLRDAVWFEYVYALP